MSDDFDWADAGDAGEGGCGGWLALTVLAVAGIVFYLLVENGILV